MFVSTDNLKNKGLLLLRMELPKRYDPKESEPKWQKFWEEKGIFKFDPDSDKDVYSIDTPPPYVSADHLHVGHALSYSQAEFIARYKRMRGFNVFYPMGFDDNGLPLQFTAGKKRICTLRVRGPSNSQKKMPCQVPSTRRPLAIAIVSEAPTRVVLTCAGELPSI